MTDKELAERITRVGERAKSNSHRIEKLEKQHEAISDLARSVAVMAERIGALSSAVKGVEEKVCALEKKPALKWERVTLYLIETAAAAVLGFLLARLKIF